MNLEELYLKNCEEIKVYEEKRAREQSAAEHTHINQNVPVFSLNDYAHPYPINIFPHRRGGVTPLHSHEFFEIIYVYQGNAFLTIHDTIHQLSAGDICMLNLQTIHALSVPDDDKSVVFNIIIMPDKLYDIYLKIISKDDLIAKFFLDSLQKPDNTNDCILFHGTISAHNAENNMQKIILEFYAASQYTEIMMSNNFVSLMIELSRWNQTIMQKKQPNLKYTNYVEILRYIENHCENVTLTILSNHFHYSSNYIASLIKNMHGKNFTELLQDIRFTKAANLLATTSLTITDIMEAVGYTNRTWFTCKFYSIYGIYPQDFRKKITVQESCKLFSSADKTGKM